MFIDPKTYYREKDESDKIINTNSKNKFTKIPKKLWEYFVSKYDGGPEFKTFRDGNNLEQENINYIKFSFTILPRKEQFNLSSNLHNIKEYTTYINKKKTIKELYERVIRIIVDNNLIEETNNLFTDSTQQTSQNKESTTYTTEDFRLYKCQNSFNDTISSFIRESENIFNSTTLLSPIELFNIINLECIYSLPIESYIQNDNTNNEKQYLFIIEQKPFIFDSSQNIKYNLCEFCRKQKLLPYQCECKTVWYCSNECLLKDKQYHINCPILLEKELQKALNLEQNELSKKGAVGLENLGGTCFMNSALQCLSNCPELTNYFLSKIFLNHINKENPLGSKGILARNYGALIKHLWYNNADIHSPKQFKNAIGTLRKQYAGNQTHDTHEFLNYILDGLHEDLNKVKRKPIIQSKDLINNDIIDSKNQWIDFLRRNQSVISELFYGQFKSTIVCPNQKCGSVNIVYEPFISLSLPLGSKIEPFTITCFYIYYNMKIKPIEIKLYFYKQTNVAHLRHKIASILNIHPMSFVVLTTADGIKKFQSFLKLDDAVVKGLKKCFLFETNPELFYSEENNKLLSSDDIELKKNHNINIELENKDVYYTRYKEVNSSIDKYEKPFKEEDNIIDYGIDLNTYVKIVLCCSNLSGVLYGLPRSVYVKKAFTGKDLYKFIFEYYIYQIRKVLTNEEYKSKSDEDLFNTLFESLINFVDSESNDIPSSQIPFTISITDSQTSSQLYILYNEVYTVDILVTKYKKGNVLELNLKWHNLYKDIFNWLVKDLNTMFKNINKNDCMGILNIHSCFSTFVAEEILEAGNTWFCPKCKEEQLAKKKIDIYKPPKVLVIHLKRFNNRDKVELKVDFPIKQTLNISEYVIDNKEKVNCEYELFGICNHIGSLTGGHYTAYAKNNGEWYYYDDPIVCKEDNIENINLSDAYVLFYKQKGNESINWNEVYNKEFVEYEGMYEKETKEENKEKLNINEMNGTEQKEEETKQELEKEMNLKANETEQKENEVEHQQKEKETEQKEIEKEAEQKLKKEEETKQEQENEKETEQPQQKENETEQKEKETEQKEKETELQQEKQKEIEQKEKETEHPQQKENETEQKEKEIEQKEKETDQQKKEKEEKQEQENEKEKKMEQQKETEIEPKEKENEKEQQQQNEKEIETEQLKENEKETEPEQKVAETEQDKEKEIEKEKETDQKVTETEQHKEIENVKETETEQQQTKENETNQQPNEEKQS